MKKTCHPPLVTGGLVVARAADQSSNPAVGVDLFMGDTGEQNIGTPVAVLPGVIGSLLRLVGQVSVDCDWMR